jgi:hypothetical protein
LLIEGGSANGGSGKRPKSVTFCDINFCRFAAADIVPPIFAEQSRYVHVPTTRNLLASLNRRAVAALWQTQRCRPRVIGTGFPTRIPVAPFYNLNFRIAEVYRPM